MPNLASNAAHEIGIWPSCMNSMSSPGIWAILYPRTSPGFWKYQILNGKRGYKLIIVRIKTPSILNGEILFESHLHVCFSYVHVQRY